MINIKMQPTDVQKLSPKITVIGVGGAGGNAVNNMISSNLEGCEFLVCNTDAQALDHSLAEHKIQLGVHVTGGLGAGSKPEIGKAAAEESLDEVLQYMDGSNMVFVTAGMGGGTGTGAAPVIAKACRERGILTVGVVTKPFHFEGTHRMKMADAGIEEMQGYVDTLIVIPNQNLFRVANEKTTFAEAFRMADSVLQSGVRGVTDLMVRPGLVNLDFADIRTAMMEMGKAMMGTGEATGDKRAIEAAEAAINNPLLDDVSMKGAHGVIINVTGGCDMTLFEADEACNRIRDEVDPEANIIFGATFDESIEGQMRVSIVATGIEKESLQNRKGGSGGFKTNVVSRQGMERAQPKTQESMQQAPGMQQPVAASVAEQAAPSVPTTKPYSSMAAKNLQGITAPAPLSSASAKTPEPEADLFEQQQFSEASGEGDDMPQNTAMRGTRYKGSFIPPKPIEVEEQQTASYQTQSYHETQQAAPSAAPAAPSGLNLNPPSQPRPQPQQEQRRSPSLFERITGTVQQHLEGMKEDHHAQPPKQRVAPTTASQGRLNIDAPAGKPKEAGSDELDIPAFLRRQAN